MKGGVATVIRDSTFRDTAYAYWSVGASTNGDHVRIDICPRVVILHRTKETGMLTTSRVTKMEWEQIACEIDWAVMTADHVVDLKSGGSRDEWSKALAKELQSRLTKQISDTCGFHAKGTDGLLLWHDASEGTKPQLKFFSTNLFSRKPIDNVTFVMTYMAPKEMAAMVSFFSHEDPQWGDVVTDNSQMLSLINAEHPSMPTKTIIIQRASPDQGQVDSAMQGVENESQLVTTGIHPGRVLRIPQDLVPIRSRQQTAQSESSTAGASGAAPEDTDLDWEVLAAGMAAMSV